VSPTLVEENLVPDAAVRVAVVVAHNEAGTWIGAVVPWEGVSIDPQSLSYDNCRGAWTRSRCTIS